MVTAEEMSNLPAMVDALRSIPWLLILVAVIAIVIGFVFISRQQNAKTPPQPSADSAPAGWHPDPTGRHHLRYWDG